MNDKVKGSQAHRQEIATGASIIELAIAEMAEHGLSAFSIISILSIHLGKQISIAMPDRQKALKCAVMLMADIYNEIREP